jgi:hypothetical protein
MALLEGIRPIFAVAVLCLAISSCQVDRPEDACPVLQGTPDPTEAGIVWGGEPAKATAQIVSVAVECIPIFEPAVETEKVKRGAYNEYQVAVTATVSYEVKDKEFVDRMPGNLEANITFEVVSRSGVVLGSAAGRFRMVGNATTGTVSARISTLADSEIRRAVAVRARWEYRS